MGSLVRAQEGEQNKTRFAPQFCGADRVFLFLYFLNKKPLRITKIDVFEKSDVEILLNFFSSSIRPFGDGFCSQNGFAKSSKKKEVN
jgi:hypothetical protein